MLGGQCSHLSRANRAPGWCAARGLGSQLPDGGLLTLINVRMCNMVAESEEALFPAISVECFGGSGFEKGTPVGRFPPVVCTGLWYNEKHVCRYPWFPAQSP